MQVRCIKPFGNARLGDVVEVPDGAAVDPAHWEAVPAAVPAPPEVSAMLDGLAGLIPVKEGM